MKSSRPVIVVKLDTVVQRFVTALLQIKAVSHSVVQDSKQVRGR